MHCCRGKKNHLDARIPHSYHFMDDFPIMSMERLHCHDVWLPVDAAHSSWMCMTCEPRTLRSEIVCYSIETSSGTCIFIPASESDIYIYTTHTHVVAGNHNVSVISQFMAMPQSCKNWHLN